MPGTSVDRAQQRQRQQQQTANAVRALQKLAGNMGQGRPVGGLDIVQPGETPGQAERRLYGTPAGFRKDIELRPEEDDAGLSRMIRLARQGLLFGVREKAISPDAIEY